MIHLLVALSSSLWASAEPLCLGFTPEVKVECEAGGDIYQIHALREKSCSAGRDGTLNGTVPIHQIEGPVWPHIHAKPMMIFKLNGQEVVLENCREV